MYIPKIDDYLKILTDEEVRDFAAINISECFKTIREEQNLRKVATSLYIFLTRPDEVERYVEIMQPNSSDNCIHHYNVVILSIFDPELQLINTKPMTKNKLKEMFKKLKKFKVQAILVLDYKKRNDQNIFHSSVKLIACDSDIDEAFRFIHQSIMKHL